MKKLKNNLKVITAFFAGVILTGGIVYAAVSANEVSYTTNKNSEIKNVQEALNDLYSKNGNKLKSNTATIASKSWTYIDTGLTNIKAATAWFGGGDGQYRVVYYFDGESHAAATYNYSMSVSGGTLGIYNGGGSTVSMTWFAVEE